MKEKRGERENFRIVNKEFTLCVEYLVYAFYYS